MPRAKVVSQEAPATTSHAKPGSRRKARPRFELPEEPAQATAAAWAFRDTPLAQEAVASQAGEPQAGEPIAATALETVPLVPPTATTLPPENAGAPPSPFSTAMFLPAATFALGAGLIVAAVFITMEAIGAPARFARRIMRIGQN